jgi:hypothetical protein
MPIPEGGLGDRLLEMHQWHTSQRIESHQATAEKNSLCWCFGEETNANKFLAKFGGERRTFNDD